MQTPPRLLRAALEQAGNILPPLTPRQLARRETILTAAQLVFAQYGTHTITMGNLALSLGMAVATLRRYFPDRDALLSALLRRHLQSLAAVIAEIPHDAPNRERLCRAAYHAATRTRDGKLTDAHTLLVRDANLLPDDERIPIENFRTKMAEVLGGNYAAVVQLFLDAKNTDLALLESRLATLAAQQTKAASPKPELWQNLKLIQSPARQLQNTA